MSAAVRMRLLCQDAEDWSARVEAALRRHDIAVVADDAGADGLDVPSLVLFDALSMDVSASVRELSAGGRNRTFAIAVCHHGLGDDGPWQLLRSGASDAFAWDDEDEPSERIVARLERWTKIDAVVRAPALRRELAGESPRWLACLRQAAEIALFSDGPVLLLGESGTGKEIGRAHV